MKIGDMVSVKKYDLNLDRFRPELMGQNAKIVDVQLQQYEKYRAYPIWARVTTGVHRGGIYGFHENEVELVMREEKALERSTGELYQKGYGQV